ncbi:phage tail protein, partial [Streptomyces sp. NPDC059096]|uniref:phage tail protein n=1 Tax=Streptomyces sp. NPDC059096 TaxID=3346727 RepID=UPI0036AEEA1D
GGGAPPGSPAPAGAGAPPPPGARRGPGGGPPAAAVRLHRIRGTRRGLAEAIRLVFGVEPEISESGAATWEARPLGAVPGEHRPALNVTVRLPNPGPADAHRLERLVAAARPAHMPYTVQVTVAERTSDR